MIKITRFLSVFLIVILFSCKEVQKGGEGSPDTTKAQEKPEIAQASFASESAEAVFKGYQEIRKALVSSDAGAARMAAQSLSETTGDDLEVKSIALSLAAEETLEEQRLIFDELTAEIEPVLRNSIADGQVYRQFCPMAFEGKGGFWISDKKEIRNPYFGESMLTCGRVTATIKK